MKACKYKRYRVSSYKSLPFDQFQTLAARLLKISELKVVSATTKMESELARIYMVDSGNSWVTYCFAVDYSIVVDEVDLAIQMAKEINASTFVSFPEENSQGYFVIARKDGSLYLAEEDDDCDINWNSLKPWTRK